MILMNKPKTNHCRFTGGSLITMASLAFALLMTMAQQAIALSVAVMPSNSQNPAKGLAQQGVALEVWGRAWDSNESFPLECKLKVTEVVLSRPVCCSEN